MEYLARQVRRNANLMNMRGWITIICMAILIIASTISYIPEVFADSALYGKLHLLILMSMVLLLTCAGNFKLLVGNRFMNGILFPLLVFSILICLFYGVGLRSSTKDIMQIGIVYVSIWIGYQLNLKNKIYTYLLLIYAMVSIFLGYASITTYLTSFSMEENMYAIDAKNQIGAIVSLACFAIFYVAQCSSNKRLTIISYTLFAALFILLLYIRCRTALLALIITVILTLYKINESHKLAVYFLCGLILMIVFANQITTIFYDAFIGDRGVANMDDLSSNRLERNEQAITYLSNHLFIGEMRYHSGIEIIHNYILNRLVRYGLWAFPLMIIYFTIGIKTLKQTFLFKRFTIHDIGYFAMLIPFICSLLEPDAPFGPGSVYSLVYILFGYSLNKSLNKI